MSGQRLPTLPCSASSPAFGVLARPSPAVTPMPSPACTPRAAHGSAATPVDDREQRDARPGGNGETYTSPLARAREMAREMAADEGREEWRDLCEGHSPNWRVAAADGLATPAWCREAHNGDGSPCVDGTAADARAVGAGEAESEARARRHSRAAALRPAPKRNEAVGGDDGWTDLFLKRRRDSGAQMRSAWGAAVVGGHGDGQSLDGSSPPASVSRPASAASRPRSAASRPTSATRLAPLERSPTAPSPLS